MTPDYAEVVASWLAKAKSDLDTASVLIRGAELHLDTGSYHCQQAAEKALKAWLTSRKQEFRKTHDLVELLSQCIGIHPEFEVLLEPSRFLVPFATQFRYPGDIFEPPLEEALQALDHASTIVRSVMQCLHD
ncbi:MAG: HEPN domain-containing protein [Terrimicrobiaceae bacterium]|jgi:HEPN domain-containing protein